MDAERQALAALQDRIRLNPLDIDALIARGIVRLRTGDLLDALLHFEAARAIDPKRAEVYDARATAQAGLGMFKQAVNSYRKRIEIEDSFQAHAGLAAVASHLNDLETAEKEYARAIEMEPSPRLHFHRAIALLGLGRWSEAWPDYSWRWASWPVVPRTRLAFPPWQGEDLTGKTIVVFQEQGYGDAIMGLRFVDELRRRYNPAKVYLEVTAPLRRLAGQIAEVVVDKAPYPAGIDYSASLFDLMMFMDITPETLPRPASYLTASCPPARRQRKKGLKVGLCWSAGRRPDQPLTEQIAIAKSVPIELIKGLLAIPGVNFYSLQMPREEIDGVADLMEGVTDFDDTASLIADLDLVISVDTAVAHLAGALGVPVWNLVRFNGTWPWLRGQPTKDYSIVWYPPEYSLWYPSMTLFRQDEMGNWAPTIARVRAKLEMVVAARAA